MLGIVVNDTVVDLVGEDHQVVLPGEIDDLAQHRLAVYGAGGIVGVDHHDTPGVAVHLGGDVGHIRLPVIGLVAQVVYGGAAGEGYRRGPQGVVGGGDENFVPGIQQRLHGHDNQLADAVAEENVVDFHVGDALHLGALHHRLAGGKYALRLGVTLGLGEVVDHILEDLIGGLEAKGRGVADVQLENAVPLILEPVGVVQHRAADVVANVVQFV